MEEYIENAGFDGWNRELAWLLIISITIESIANSTPKQCMQHMFYR